MVTPGAAPASGTTALTGAVSSAPVGQTAAHAPQPVQRSLAIWGGAPFREMALVGQMPTQRVQVDWRWRALVQSQGSDAQLKKRHVLSPLPLHGRLALAAGSPRRLRRTSHIRMTMSEMASRAGATA